MMIKKGLKIAGIILIGLILAMIIVPFIFEDEIKDGVRQALNEQLNAQSDFEDISLSLWKDFPNATLTITELKIEGLDTFDQLPLFHAVESEVEISLPSLFNEGPYEVKSLTIEDPLINIVILENGQSNYLITKESEGETAYNIALKNYEIKNGTLTYHDSSLDLEAEVIGLNHKGSGDFTQDIYDLNMKTVSNDFNVNYNGIPVLKKTELDWDAILNVDLAQEKYTFKDNQLNINKIQMLIDGYFHRVEEDIMTDLTFSAPNADFGQIYSLIPYAYAPEFAKAQFKGSGNLSGFVKGIMNMAEGKTPHYGMVLNVENGFVQYEGIAKAITDIFINMTLGNYENKPNSLKVNIPRFNLKSGDDFIIGNLTTTGTTTNPKIDGSFKTNLNLQSWQQVLPLAEKTEISGMVQSDISIKTDFLSIKNRNYEKIDFFGNAIIDALQFQPKNGDGISIGKMQIQASPNEMNGTFVQLNTMGSDADIDWSIINPLGYFTDLPLDGSVVIRSNTLDLNPFIAIDTSSQTTLKALSLPKGKIDINAYVKNILFDQQTYVNNEATGYYLDNQLVINSAQANYGGNDFRGNGVMRQLEEYLNKQDNLLGELYIQSNKLNVNDYMTESSTSDTSFITVPELIDLKVHLHVDALQYQNIEMNDVNGLISVIDESIAMEEVQSSSFGGSLNLNGLYATPGGKQPIFDLKLDVNKVQFSKAFQEVNTFGLLAPVGKFIEGIFNSTFVISGKLGNDMMPVVNSLNASGYMETINGAVTGYEPINKIANKLGLEFLNSWNLTNTKNWFEVVDGTLQLKEKTFDLGQGIEANLSGSHKLGADMDYSLVVSIPRVLLKGNVLSNALEGGLSTIEQEAQKIGINLDQGSNLLVKIGITGMVSNPSLSFTPVGTSGKKLGDLAKEEIDKQKQEAIDKITEEIDKKKKEAKDSVQKVIDKSVDSLENVTSDKIQEVRDSLEKKAEKEIQSRLDSLAKKKGLDTLTTKVEDIIKENTGKEVDKLKDELDKWNPFKKKKISTDTTKNN